MSEPPDATKARAVRQDDLHDDAARLDDYGAQHLDTWTGIKFEGGRLVALCTDPDRHRDAVRRLVNHPDSLDLRRAPYSRSHLDVVHSVVRALSEREPGTWTACGPGLTAVNISFRGGYDHLARELHEQFGDAIKVTVGAFAYPVGLEASSRLRAAPTSTVDFPAARVEVVPASAAAPVGTDVTGDVRITNESTVEQLTIDTGQPLDGLLIDDDHRVVGAAHGFKGGTGYGVRLDPGATATIRFSAGVDSLDPRLGTTLPAGEYRLIVTIPVHDRANRDARIVTAPVPIELTG